MKKRFMPPLVLILIAFGGASAQRPSDSPATAPAGKPPDSVFLEDLTWAEVRDLIKAGTTTVIVGTAGTEQKGPHSDPTKATAEIGKMGIEFKVNAAINQYNAIKNPPRGRGQREGASQPPGLR